MRKTLSLDIKCLVRLIGIVDGYTLSQIQRPDTPFMHVPPTYPRGKVSAAETSAVCRAGARRGVTLIEAVLYISVALGLIIGGLVFYQQATRSATYQSVVRGLQVVQSEVRAMYQISKWPNQILSQAWGDITPGLIQMAAVPREMIDNSGTEIRLTRESRLIVQHRRSIDGVFQTRYRVRDVPEWLCTRLVVATITGGAAGPGALGYGVMNDIESIEFTYTSTLRQTHSFGNGDLTPALAAQLCRNDATRGVLPVVVFITQPPS